MLRHALVEAVQRDAGAGRLARAHGAAVGIPALWRRAVDLASSGAVRRGARARGRPRRAALCFFGTRRALLVGHRARPPGAYGYGAAVVYVFVTAVHGGVLGALLTVSPRVWYAPYLAHHPAGLTPLEDQQLAGLLMWVPAGLAFVAGALFLFAAWLRQSDRLSRFKSGPRAAAYGYPMTTCTAFTRRARALAGAGSRRLRRQSDLPGGGARSRSRPVPGAPPTIASRFRRLGRRVAHAGRRLRQSPLQHARHHQDDERHEPAVVTTFSTGVPHGHEGQPLVFGNTMYVVTPFPNNLIAVDLTKPGGAVKWIYEPHPDPRAVGIACCDVVNRGASLRRRQDHLQPARRARSSRSTPRPARRSGERASATSTSARRSPRRRSSSRTRCIVGNSGGELGVRGYVAALDVDTGKELWRALQHRPRQRREDRRRISRRSTPRIRARTSA